jgi:hypothetical protein
MHPALIRLRMLAALGLATLPTPSRAQTPPRVVHVYVALADNQHQGIVPVPAPLGNGSEPARNLYWGAAFGVKTYFKASPDWELISCGHGPKSTILESCTFKYRASEVYLITDAYEGASIREAVTDFLAAAAGTSSETVPLKIRGKDMALSVAGAADLVVYVGHDAFMDFQIAKVSGKATGKPRTAIVLACASKQYFGPYVRETAAYPLLWTTGLMAPEAYTLKAALDGWIVGEGGEGIRLRAAHAYDKYQKCGFKAAQRLFATGW